MQIQVYNYFTEEGQLYQGDEEKIVRELRKDHAWLKGNTLDEVLEELNQSQALVAGPPAEVDGQSK